MSSDREQGTKLNKWKPASKRKQAMRVADEPIEQAFVDVTTCRIVPPQFVVANLLPVGMTLLQGPPKEAYKSTISIIVACLVARWQCQALPPWMYSTMWGPTMVWAMEAEPGEINWIIRDALQVEPEDSTIWAAQNPWEYKLDADDRCEHMLAWLRKYKPRLTILDPFRNMWGGDENDSGAILFALQPLAAWHKANNAAMLVVHHTAKPTEGRDLSNIHAGRGSSALPGMADGILTIQNGDQQGRLKVNAVFKRGATYKRIIDVGVPGYGWRRTGREVLTKQSEQLLTRLRNGEDFVEAVTSLSLNAAQAQECIDQLTRNDLWQATME